MPPTRCSPLIITISILFVFVGVTLACSNGGCKVGEKCSGDGDCSTGLYCFMCGLEGSRCVRMDATNQFAILNNSLPFNKYSFLATHNSFAITGKPPAVDSPRITFTNQEDSVTQQLMNGVRTLLLDTYDFKGEVWLCHSIQKKCFDFTAFNHAIDTFQEIRAFLASNPSEIVTLILEDYVTSANGLTKLFEASGLKQFWFPVEKMPKNGEDWPLVKDMVAANQRLIVFTSAEAKQASEGIAYQWNYMVETKFGNDGEEDGKCSNRKESAPLSDKTKSLFFLNYFKTIPVKELACKDNSKDLSDMIQTCYGASGNRWPNFIAVDFYKRSEGGGAFQAIDQVNGRLLCGCNDVHSCAPGTPCIP